MSRLVILRNNDSFYVTDAQAEAIFAAINANPNLRMIKILTNTGYRYTNPSNIIDMKKGLGEDYRPDDQIIADQRKALRELRGKQATGLLTAPGQDGIIGLLEAGTTSQTVL